MMTMMTMMMMVLIENNDNYHCHDGNKGDDHNIIMKIMAMMIDKSFLMTDER